MIVIGFVCSWPAPRSAERIGRSTLTNTIVSSGFTRFDSQRFDRPIQQRHPPRPCQHSVLGGFNERRTKFKSGEVGLACITWYSFPSGARRQFMDETAQKHPLREVFSSAGRKKGGERRRRASGIGPHHMSVSITLIIPCFEPCRIPQEQERPFDSEKIDGQERIIQRKAFFGTGLPCLHGRDWTRSWSENTFVNRRTKTPVWNSSRCLTKISPCRGPYNRPPCGANRNKPPALPGAV